MQRPFGQGFIVITEGHYAGNRSHCVVCTYHGYTKEEYACV